MIPTKSNAEVNCIIKFFWKADYLLQFISNILNDFIKSTNDLKDSYIIPPNLSEQRKPFFLIEIPFCDKSGRKSKDFIPKDFIMKTLMSLLTINLK